MKTISKNFLISEMCKFCWGNYRMVLHGRKTKEIVIYNTWYWSRNLISNHLEILRFTSEIRRNWNHLNFCTHFHLFDIYMYCIWYEIRTRLPWTNNGSTVSWTLVIKWSPQRSTFFYVQLIASMKFSWIKIFSDARIKVTE